MPYLAALVYQNSEALRCAAAQDTAHREMDNADHVTDGLDGRVRTTYGKSASAIRDDIKAAMRARTEAIQTMQELCARLAQFCRTADTAYQNVDEQAAENFNQH